MLKYRIEVACNVAGCDERVTLERTVQRPGPYDMPSLHSWNGPFEAWSFEEDQPTRCPMHKRIEAARREAEKAEAEAGGDA